MNTFHKEHTQITIYPWHMIMQNHCKFQVQLNDYSLLLLNLELMDFQRTFIYLHIVAHTLFHLNCTAAKFQMV